MYKIIVPTLNAARDWPTFAPALLACARPDQVLIVDSESSDDTVALAQAAGFTVHSIARSSFNHGGTRQLGAELAPEADVLVYLTQDAFLENSESIQELLKPFADPEVGATYGRQLPNPDARPIEAHARLFNYPASSSVRTLESRDQIGFKAIFLSNSLAAYRRSALMSVGGFPKDSIFGEDTVTAAKMLLAGYKIAYVAEACASHSHSYTVLQEFKRYFDIGVLHSRESWLLDEFGRTGGEGRRFVLSEMRYLLKRNALLIPSAILRTAIKYTGYRLGLLEASLPQAVKPHLSMHGSYWLAAESH
jgi:rhamnosyltransferase